MFLEYIYQTIVQKDLGVEKIIPTGHGRGCDLKLLSRWLGACYRALKTHKGE